MSTFTPSACYDLSTHTINFDHHGVEVINDAEGKKVDGATFADGFDIKVIDDEFCFGTISFTTYFDVAISTDDPDWGFLFEHKQNGSYIVGSDELDIPQVTKHVYNIEDCPIRLTENVDEILVRCPCTTSGSPCTNSCYQEN